jgi:hypothetical protein
MNKLKSRKQAPNFGYFNYGPGKLTAREVFSGKLKKNIPSVRMQPRKMPLFPITST